MSCFEVSKPALGSAFGGYCGSSSFKFGDQSFLGISCDAVGMFGLWEILSMMIVVNGSNGFMKILYSNLVKNLFQGFFPHEKQ